jgi:DNA polymerase
VRNANAAAEIYRETKARAARCRNCALWENATQTVFGAGAVRTPLMFVGEQPGDKEDRAGLPFVGPAGHMIDRALAELGVARDRVYTTNAVKHFKFKPSGKRRLHKTPAQREIEACRPWLLEEIEFVDPKLIVALGATAARALLNRSVPIHANRGREFATESGHRVLLTIHPAALLRMPVGDRETAYQMFIGDLMPIKTIAQ